MQYVLIDGQVADILTKDLGRGKHVYFRDKLGVVKNTFSVRASVEKLHRKCLSTYTCLGVDNDTLNGDP